MEKKTILVVDDEEGLVELLKLRLESAGYRVLTAYDGLWALERSRQHPDLIILDIMMPGMDGMEVLRRLKHDVETMNIPVIMLTAKGDSKSMLDAESAGMTDYLIKPFGAKELLELISRYI